MLATPSCPSESHTPAHCQPKSVALPLREPNKCDSKARNSEDLAQLIHQMLVMHRIDPRKVSLETVKRLLVTIVSSRGARV